MRLRVSHVIITYSCTLKTERLRLPPIARLSKNFRENFLRSSEVSRGHSEFVNLFFLLTPLFNGFRGSFVEGKVAEE